MEHSGTKISPTALFSADGLIIVVTGGGSGEKLLPSLLPSLCTYEYVKQLTNNISCAW